jgi:hypothetical protein
MILFDYLGRKEGNMKKVIPVFALAIFMLVVAPPAEGQQSPSTVAPGQEITAPVQPSQETEGKVLSPEAFYKFEIDRLSLLKEHKSKFLQLLKAAKTKDDALIQNIVDANKSIVEDFIALTQKDNVTADDYKQTLCATTGKSSNCKAPDPEAQKADQEYTSKHPEILQEIKNTQGETMDIEQQISNETKRLKITSDDLVRERPNKNANVIYCQSADGKCNIRALPNPSSEIKRKDKNGEAYEFKTKVGEWYELKSGGYIHKSVVLDKNIFCRSPDGSCNIRSLPNSSSDIVRTDKNGQAYEYKNRVGEWYELKSGGYIHKKMVSETAP